MFWALSCIWWNVFLANYLLAICGPWHTTLLWFVSAELGKSVLQCGLKSAPEKKNSVTGAAAGNSQSTVRQWKICWIQNEITSSRSILHTALGVWVSQTQDWFNVWKEECLSGLWEDLAEAFQSFRPQVSGSRVLVLSEALASLTLPLQVLTNLLPFEICRC